MSDASILREDVRIAAKALIRREEYRTGSRMLAYENVAQMVGASGAWLRKFVNGYADVGLSFIIGMNIVTLYGRVCERVQTAALELENENAATKRALEIVESKMRTARPTPDVESS